MPTPPAPPAPAATPGVTPLPPAKDDQNLRANAENLWVYNAVLQHRLAGMEERDKSPEIKDFEASLKAYNSAMATPDAFAKVDDTGNQVSGPLHARAAYLKDLCDAANRLNDEEFRRHLDKIADLNAHKDEVDNLLEKHNEHNKTPHATIKVDKDKPMSLQDTASLMGRQAVEVAVRLALNQSPALSLLFLIVLFPAYKAYKSHASRKLDSTDPKSTPAAATPPPGPVAGAGAPPAAGVTPGGPGAAAGGVTPGGPRAGGARVMDSATEIFSSSYGPEDARAAYARQNFEERVDAMKEIVDGRRIPDSDPLFYNMRRLASQMNDLQAERAGLDSTNDASRIDEIDREQRQLKYQAFAELEVIEDKLNQGYGMPDPYASTSDTFVSPTYDGEMSEFSRPSAPPSDLGAHAASGYRSSSIFDSSLSAEDRNAEIYRRFDVIRAIEVERSIDMDDDPLFGPILDNLQLEMDRRNKAKRQLFELRNQEGADPSKIAKLEGEIKNCDVYILEQQAFIQNELDHNPAYAARPSDARPFMGSSSSEEDADAGYRYDDDDMDMDMGMGMGMGMGMAPPPLRRSSSDSLTIAATSPLVSEADEAILALSRQAVVSGRLVATGEEQDVTHGSHPLGSPS